jgi:DNA-binding CsgD family transcriptional regulator
MKFISIIALSILLLSESKHSFADSSSNSNFRIYMFTDPSGTIGVEKVSALLNDQAHLFIPSNRVQGDFDLHATYWLYLQPIDSNNNKEYVLTFRMWVSQIEVYPYPYSTISGYGGQLIPGRLKELSGSNVFLGSGARKYLLKVQSKIYSGASVRDIKIMPAHTFQKKKEQFGILQGFMQGFFWLMLIYNLLLYFIIRKKAHLFYVIYIFFNSLYMLFAFSYSETLLFPNNEQLNLVLFTFQPIGLFFYTMFLRLMLLNHCPAYTHSIDRKTFYPYSYLLLFVNLIIASTVFFRINIFITAFQISNLINCIIGISLLSYFYKKSDRVMHIIIAGSLIMILFGLVGILNVPIDVDLNNLYYEIGLLTELLFFTYAINREYQQDIEKRYKAELIKQQLENELENNKRKLVYQATLLLAKNETIASIKDTTSKLKLSKKDSTAISNEFRSTELMNKNLWEEFDLHFNETYPGFYKALLEKHPDLTQNELKLCAFLKLNLNTKEIATITQKNPHSIEAMRSRIRQKMHLDRDTNFNLVLAQF